MAEATREEAHAAWTAAVVMGVETAIAALALFFLVRTYQEVRRTADAVMETARTAHREFIASHRPRMVVWAFRLSRPEFFSEHYDSQCFRAMLGCWRKGRWGLNPPGARGRTEDSRVNS